METLECRLQTDAAKTKVKGQMFGRRHHQIAEESIEFVVRCGAYFEV